MELAHYCLSQGTTGDQPKLLFDVRLEIQDVRSGYEGHRFVKLMADWLEDPDLRWTPDMVREVSSDELSAIEPVRPVTWPRSADELIAEYVTRLEGPSIWYSRDLGVYSTSTEKMEEFLHRCRDLLVEERLASMRQLSELVFHRFLKLESRLFESLESEEGLDETVRLGLESDLRQLFSEVRDRLSRIFMEDHYQLLSVDDLNWVFPRRPEFAEFLHHLASDLVRDFNSISRLYEDRARNVEPYRVSMNSARVEMISRGVVWTR